MEEFCLHTLNSNWTIWYHKSNDTNWNLESYIKLATLSSVEDFSIVYNSLKRLTMGSCSHFHFAFHLGGF